MTFKTYHDHTIAFSPDDMKFHVTGPLFEGDGMNWASTFASYTDATVEIDKRSVAAEKQARASATIALQALNGLGEPVTIKGVHATRHCLLGFKPSELPNSRGFGRGHEDGDAYPPVEWVKSLLAERVRLLARLVTVGAVLRVAAISSRRSERDPQSRQPLSYEQIVAALDADYKEKLRQAQEGPPTGAAQAA